MFEKIMDNVKIQKPLVHCITNSVTMNDCANAILAVHGSPIMADEIKEVEDITSICQALVINIGTLNERTVEAMIKAGQKANALNHPVILDPVGAGASSFRSETTFRLLDKIQFSVIRGNISEIKTVYQGIGTTKGVDADINDIVNEENLDETIDFARELSQRTGAIIAITGAIDIIADANHATIIRNGCSNMSRITGTGCMLSAILGAYVAVNQDSMFDTVSCAVALMGYSGELAQQKVQQQDAGTGSLRVYLIDALSTMTAEKLNGGIKIEER
ncbi:hydroxyethylthiazole kinase [Longibaculum muris]|uniref:hydroxyethylthiazole kinase n=1 Tax=Longibaculum muris TaxID=1796628 RepID=UPI00189E1C3E|nr:hydroxyethylthiazole kinase [Longibaculum muris]